MVIQSRSHCFWAWHLHIKERRYRWPENVLHGYFVVQVTSTHFDHEILLFALVAVLIREPRSLRKMGAR